MICLLITIRHKGNFDKSFKFLNRAIKSEYRAILEKYGELGIEALSSYTPVDSGETAKSWYYEIYRRRGKLLITWSNSNIVKGVPISIILQYGHATRNGGYVQGTDYINPALASIFASMAEEVWKEVTCE